MEGLASVIQWFSEVLRAYLKTKQQEKKHNPGGYLGSRTVTVPALVCSLKLQLATGIFLRYSKIHTVMLPCVTSEIRSLLVLRPQDQLASTYCFGCSTKWRVAKQSAETLAWFEIICLRYVLLMEFCWRLQKWMITRGWWGDKVEYLWLRILA